MEDFLIYLLKSAGLISIFYICYVLLLRNDTSFSLNRKYLISGIFAAAVLPSLYFTKKIFVETPKQFFYTESSGSLNEATSVSGSYFINIWEVAGSIFFLVTILLFMRFLFQIFRIIHLIRTHDQDQVGKYVFIETQQEHGPFSFFKYIVYNPKLHDAKELELIFKHEKVHSSQFHTLDILISSLACCILWFNPLSWLYKKSIIQNLEFIADKETVAATQSKKEYLKTLVKVTMGDLQPALTNSFYQSFIKKRIIMLNKSSHANNNFWKVSLVFPAILAFMLTFNVQTEFYAQEKVSSINSQNVVVQIEIDKNTTQDKLDDYKSLMDKHGVILKFSDIKYNQEGFLSNITVEFIDKSNVSSGSITKSNSAGIDAFRYVYNQEEGSKFSSSTDNISIAETVTLKGLKTSVNDSTSASGKTFTYVATKNKPLYVVQGNYQPTSSQGNVVYSGSSTVSISGNNIKQGVVIVPTRKGGDSTNYGFSANRVYFMDSVRFTNKDYDASQISNARANPLQPGTTAVYFKDSLFISEGKKLKPLYVVDGKEMDKSFKVANLNSQNVRSMNIIKGTAAITKYGEKAKDGVIEISTVKNTAINIGTLVTISPTSSHKDLQEFKKRLKAANIEAEFKNVKRNKEGLITNIKITAKYKSKELSATFSEKGGIPEIFIGLSNDILAMSHPKLVKKSVQPHQ